MIVLRFYATGTFHLVPIRDWCQFGVDVKENTRVASGQS